MEWVETTAKSIAEAQDQALDQLGVAADDAEFEVLEEPKSGLFGRVRGEARVRARVKPTAVRPKQERRQRGRNQKRDGKKSSGGDRNKNQVRTSNQERIAFGRSLARPQSARAGSEAGSTEAAASEQGEAANGQRTTPFRGHAARSRRCRRRVHVALTEAFGVDGANTELDVDGTDLDVRVTGSELGLMVGPGGRTLTAIQDLARVASQRRLGDHETRLRIDVGGYREKRREALEKFAATVAAQVIDSGTPKALEPMPSADRKAVHDAVIEIDGVTSHSEGDDPRRRVVITPA